MGGGCRMVDLSLVEMKDILSTTYLCTMGDTDKLMLA